MTRFASIKLRLYAATTLMLTAFAGLVTWKTEATPASAQEKQDRLAERDRLHGDAILRQTAGDLPGATALYAKKLAIERSVLGALHEDVAATLLQLAELHAYQDAFAEGRQAARAAIDIQSKRAEAKPWQLADARRVLNDIENLAKMPLADRRQLAQASRLNEQLIGLYLASNFAEGLKLAAEIETIYQRTHGTSDPRYAGALGNHGLFLHCLGKYREAEAFYRKALPILKASVGEEHPDYATTLTNLAVLHGIRGDFVDGLPIYQRALELRKQVLGTQHPDYVRSLNNLAWVHKANSEFDKADQLYAQAMQLHEKGLSYGWPNPRLLEIYRQVDLRRPPGADKMQTDRALIVGNRAVVNMDRGDYARAEPLFRKALELYKETLGERHALYANNLSHLATLYHLMGDDARAEPLLLQAAELRKRMLGPMHSDYAQSLQVLAKFYQLTGDHKKAEEQILKVLEIRKEAFGEKHHYYGGTLNVLASIYHAQGEYARAEPLYAEALKSRADALGEKRLKVHDAAMVINQALLYQAMGEPARAEKLFQTALGWIKNEIGVNNPEYVRGLYHLALLHLAGNKHELAEDEARQSVDISRKLLEQCAAIQSERQQMAMMQTTRSYLDGYLSLTAEAKTSPEQVYTEVLGWKGAVTLRQQGMRRLRRSLEKEGNSAALKLFDDLEQATRRLSSLSKTNKSDTRQDNLREELDRLSAEIERLERALSGIGKDFLGNKGRTPGDITATLPADAVLLDLLEYNQVSAPKSGQGEFASQRCLAAFVLRKGQAVKRIELGPVAPIAAALTNWRRELFQGGQNAELARPLRRLLWEPLADEVQGAKVILVSPDGAVARLPWTVLPGSKPGSYLIEEYAIAVVPVPAQLPEFGERDRATAPPSMLLVGDVNFDAIPGAVHQLALAASAPLGTRTGSPLQWNALPGTRTEVTAVQAAFHKRYPDSLATVLRQEDATEEAVRRQAAKHRYLHFATHGFFAAAAGQPDKPGPGGSKPGLRPVRSDKDVTGFHPGLLSGLVLSGANQPVQPDRDDGILTALEVAELDLAEADLAVLSACETGLGESTGGEGLLGLQRAFHMAGARTVVAGFWKVPDKGTQVLMQRFYDNQWQKNMGKLEALREAQLWMLREGEKTPGLVRGLGVDEPAPAGNGQLSPFYWGAFVLSGDWR